LAPRTFSRISLSLCALVIASTLPALSVAAAPGDVSRQAGLNRYATAAQISHDTFSPGVNVAYVVNGLGFADALGAGAAAAELGGPLLLVTQSSIPSETATELDRLNPDEIIVAGGIGVVSDAVKTALGAYSSTVNRQAGLNRYATAAAISAGTFDPGVNVVYVANGLGFPDALAAGPAAAELGGPLLLVTASSIPSETATELDRLNPDEIIVAGGTGVVSDAVKTALGAYSSTVNRQAGLNRYATAAAISAGTFDPGVNVVYVANGLGFPDALAAGPAAAHLGGPLLLVSQCAIPSETATELDRLNPGQIIIAGGTGVVCAALESQLQAFIPGMPPNANNDNLGNVKSDCKWQYRVLNNDTDAEGATLSITAVSDPAHGTAGILTHRLGGVEIPRVVSYVSDSGYTGADSFNYTISDGAGGSDTATVNLTVIANSGDTDGDGQPDECDAFATDGTNASGRALPFSLTFDAGGGEIEDGGFTGLMTNSFTPSLTQYNPALVGLDGSGHFVVDQVPEGDSANGGNDLKNGFQVNVTMPVSSFTVHGRVCSPYPPGVFASAGIIIGPGNQDNYIKAVIETSTGTGVHDSREVNGEGSIIAAKLDAAIGSAACTDLYLYIDTVAHTYSPTYSTNNGVTRSGFTTGAGARTVPASWTDGTQALAVGIFSTSQGPASPYTATFDLLEVHAGLP
jgi:putative cell wall-binding protein